MKLFGTQKRGLAALTIILAIAAGAIAAGSWMFQGPPDPTTASREAILRWLVLSDITHQPVATQLALVDRLEGELQKGLDVPPADTLGEKRLEVFSRNVTALKRLWFIERVKQYHSLPGQERKHFMDERVATVLAWSSMEDALQSSGKSNTDVSNTDVSSTNIGGAVSTFFDEIETWIAEESDVTLQGEMSAAVYDGLVRWLATHTLAEHPMSVRTELALRIAEQLDAGLQLTGLPDDQESSSANEESEMLRDNCELLMEAWVRVQAQRYYGLARDSQEAFIAQQIDNVTKWGVIELLAGGDGKPAHGAMRMLTLSQQWIERAPEEQRPQLQNLLRAVQAHMMMRMLKSPD